MPKEGIEATDITCSKQELINNVKEKRPHVVILGAGASIAASGGKNIFGKPLPSMDNLIDIVGLKDDLTSYDIPYPKEENFENLYSLLHENGHYTNLLQLIEKRVSEYFSDLRLPDYPTLYDHLVLSLRGKDVIATFNWDPLLFQAWSRNYNIVQLPKIFFLHGNTAVGYCKEHKKFGPMTGYCPTCYNRFTASKLFFPVLKKDYSYDPFIRAHWDSFQHYLKSAYIITIFGYGAPKSDVEAIKLMKTAWGPVKNREFEQIEIIDIKTEDELTQTWDDFIFSHHYQTTKDFYQSIIGLFPRRTCEALWTTTLEARETENNPIPKQYDFKQLHQWYQLLNDIEKKKI